MLASAKTPLFADEEAKKALIGLARDLRGLAFAFNTKTSYMMLFDWMYPFSIMQWFLESRTPLATNTISEYILSRPAYNASAHERLNIATLVLFSCVKNSRNIQWCVRTGTTLQRQKVFR